MTLVEAYLKARANYIAASAEYVADGEGISGFVDEAEREMNARFSDLVGSHGKQSTIEQKSHAWGLANVYTLARRRLNALPIGHPEREWWEHVKRISEEAGVRQNGILRHAVPTEVTEGEKSPSLPPVGVEGRQKDYASPLDVTIEHDALVIRIGIQTLAHAVTYSDWANPYDEKTGDYIRDFAIVDAPQFAKDVASAMECEREDGSTPLSDFLDKMSEEAINQGSLGLHEDEQRIKHGEKSPLEKW